MGQGVWALEAATRDDLVTAAEKQLEEAQVKLQIVGVDEALVGPRVRLDPRGGPQDGLRRMGGDPASLDVYLVACIEAPDGRTGQLHSPEGTALRIPAGLMGPGFVDGVVVQYGSCVEDPRAPGANARVARVLAHVLGHALGLRHSVEADGTEDGPPDTSADNLMFWAPGGLEDLQDLALSARQVQIMRRHPLLRLR